MALHVCCFIRPVCVFFVSFLFTLDFALLLSILSSSVFNYTSNDIRVCRCKRVRKRVEVAQRDRMCLFPFNSSYAAIPALSIKKQTNI